MGVPKLRISLRLPGSVSQLTAGYDVFLPWKVTTLSSLEKKNTAGLFLFDRTHNETACLALEHVHVGFLLLQPLEFRPVINWLPVELSLVSSRASDVIALARILSLFLGFDLNHGKRRRNFNRIRSAQGIVWSEYIVMVARPDTPF